MQPFAKALFGPLDLPTNWSFFLQDEPMAVGKAPYYLLPKPPFQLAPKPIKDTQFKALIKELKFLNLKHANRIEYCYDPFHPNVKCVR